MLGDTIGQVLISFNPRIAIALNMWVKYLVTNSRTYNMLLGMELLSPLGFFVET